jgi:hypothetical protein
MEKQQPVQPKWYWRDIHCNCPHDEGACNQLFELSAPAANVMLL